MAPQSAIASHDVDRSRSPRDSRKSSSSSSSSTSSSSTSSTSRSRSSSDVHRPLASPPHPIRRRATSVAGFWCPTNDHSRFAASTGAAALRLRDDSTSRGRSRSGSGHRGGGQDGSAWGANNGAALKFSGGGEMMSNQSIHEKNLICDTTGKNQTIRPLTARERGLLYHAARTGELEAGVGVGALGVQLNMKMEEREDGGYAPIIIPSDRVIKCPQRRAFWAPENQAERWLARAPPKDRMFLRTSHRSRAVIDQTSTTARPNSPHAAPSRPPAKWYEAEDRDAFKPKEYLSTVLSGTTSSRKSTPREIGMTYDIERKWYKERAYEDARAKGKKN